MLLDARSRLDEPLWLRTRHGNWDMHPSKDLLLIDIFAGDAKAGPARAVAHYDWEITGSSAYGNKNRHSGLLPSHDWDRAADRKWSGNAFEVDGIPWLKYAEQTGKYVAAMRDLRERGFVKNDDDWMNPIYQRFGLGQLLIVAAAINLQDLGVESMDLGQLSALAKKAWKKFGVEGSTATTPVDIIVHPNAEPSIRPFVGGA